MNKKLVSIIFLVLVLSLSASCNNLTGPKASSKVIFEEWARFRNTPYQNVSFKQLRTDGTFATIQISAELRENSQSDWVPMQTSIECRKVGGNWTCGAINQFSLIPSLVSGTETAWEATAETRATQMSAKKTEEVQFERATAVEENRIVNSVGVVRHIDDYEIKFKKSKEECFWHGGIQTFDCWYVDKFHLSVVINNRDAVEHKIRLRIYVFLIGGRFQQGSYDDGFWYNLWWEGVVQPGENLRTILYECSLCYPNWNFGVSEKANISIGDSCVEMKLVELLYRESTC